VHCWIVREATVPIKMGTGLPYVPHTFKVGQVLDRGGYVPGFFEELHRQGVRLEPVG
jgi:hypothetical protein